MQLKSHIELEAEKRERNMLAVREKLFGYVRNARLNAKPESIEQFALSHAFADGAEAAMKFALTVLNELT